MRIKSCLYFLGIGCFPISFLALLNIFYSLHFDNFSNINSYTVTLFLSLITGFIFFKIGKNFKDDITAYEEIFLVLLVYFLICFSLSRYSLRVENKLMVSHQK